MVLIQLEYLDRDLVTQDMTSDMYRVENTVESQKGYPLSLSSNRF
jgi:hypothetical protein